MNDVRVRVAYSIPEAAAAVGVSRSTVQRAIDAGDLVVHYPNSKPLILADDLREWVASAPTERSA